MSLPSSHVAELVECVREISANYAIWHLLSHPDDRAPYASSIDKYEGFFSPTALSHFQSVAVGIYQLMDERPDALSVPNALRSIKAWHPNVVRKIELSLQPTATIFHRMATLRHKVFAHRDARASPDLVYADVGLTPELIWSCVSLMIDAVEEIALATVPGAKPGEVVSSAHAAADSARDNLKRLLGAL